MTFINSVHLFYNNFRIVKFSLKKSILLCNALLVFIIRVWCEYENNSKDDKDENKVWVKELVETKEIEWNWDYKNIKSVGRKPYLYIFCYCRKYFLMKDKLCFGDHLFVIGEI